MWFTESKQCKESDGRYSCCLGFFLFILLSSLCFGLASFSKWRDTEISRKQLELATSRKIAKTIWFPEWDLFMMQHVQDFIRGASSTDQVVDELTKKVADLKKQYQ